MITKQLTAFRMATDIMAAMRALKDRDGIPMAEQIDRALRQWLAEKGVMKTPRKGARRS